MFHARDASAFMWRATLRVTTVLWLTSACRIGEHIAEPPVDAGDGSHADADPRGGGSDGGDGGPGDDAFHGLTATIGERPEWSGTCTSIDQRDEMDDRFDPIVQQQRVTAGWEFDTAADSYDDPSYGVMPAWPAPAESGRFSLRLHGALALPPGTHCFSVDIGATGTDIVGGRNGCGQLWLGDGAAPLAVTGFDAPSVDAAVACAEVAPGDEVAIVFWYFNIFEQAKLRVRHCAGAGCTPDQPLIADDVRAP